MELHGVWRASFRLKCVSSAAAPAPAAASPYHHHWPFTSMVRRDAIKGNCPLRALDPYCTEARTKPSPALLLLLLLPTSGAAAAAAAEPRRTIFTSRRGAAQAYPAVAYKIGNVGQERAL